MNTSLKAAMALAAVTAISVPSSTLTASGAETAKATKCTFTGIVVRVEPGMTTREATSKFRQTNRGTVTCNGPVLGRTVTGPGTWLAVRGRGTGSCTGGSGVFTQKFRFPTATGPLTLVNKGSFTFGALEGGGLGGRFDGDRMKGSFTVSPKKGDCLTTPVTRFSEDGQGTLKPRGRS